jgi:hypothetical protein
MFFTCSIIPDSFTLCTQLARRGFNKILNREASLKTAYDFMASRLVARKQMVIIKCNLLLNFVILF